MANKDGGELYIGVLERERYDEEQDHYKLEKVGAVYKQNRIILGVEPELKEIDCNIDNHMLQMNNWFRSRLGEGVMPYIQVTPINIFGRHIYKIIIKQYTGNEGVYLDNEKFFLRENNETVPKTPKEAHKYLINRKVHV